MANPYELDFIDYKVNKNKTIKLAALTNKNRDFIEGILRIDSSYKNEQKNNSNDTAGYHFRCIKNNEGSYKEHIKEAVRIINKTNSTHLGASENAVDEITNRITTLCKSYDELKEKLEISFDMNDKDSLIAVITKGITAKRKKIKAGDRYNLSFASKFCSYACQFLDIKCNYPRYDTIVSNVLPYYYNYYLSNRGTFNKRSKQYYKADNNADNKLENRLDVYHRYINDIKEILNVVKEGNVNLDFNTLDHIIWYTNK